MKPSTWANIWAAAVILCAATARAGDRDWKFSSSLNYETGDYGTNTRTSSLYIPLTIKRYWGDWNASLTVPYLSQTSDGGVTNVGGRPNRTGRRSTGAPATTTHSGLGDVILRGGYDILTEGEGTQPFDLSAAAKVKAPTADKNKGLGTGEFDAGLGLEFGKLAAPGWTVLADAYYTMIGDPPGVNLRNQLAVDAGFIHPLATDLTLTVLLEGSNALVPGESAPVDLRGILEYKVSDQVRASCGLMVGLTDGAPDAGFSLGGSYRF